MKKQTTILFYLLFSVFFASSVAAADSISLWFAPGWKSKAQQAKTICDSLSQDTGLTIEPRIAKSYPDILDSLQSKEQALVYTGSFVQAIIKARDLGTPLLQGLTGKEMYAGILIYPKDQDPQAILQNSPSEIAFAASASSGESSAKAATGGKASMKVRDHNAAVGAVKVGRAKAAVVKNHWWASNAKRFPEMAVYNIPGISEEKNPDNVLSASNSVPAEVQEKIKKAAISHADVFGVKEMVPLDSSKMEFSLELMSKGNIDPSTYAW